MATDGIIGKKIAKNFDREAVAGVKNDSGTYVGIVKDNLAPARNGALRVWIPDFGGDENSEHNWRKVNYASPYMGTTFAQPGDINNKFADVHHTYGMWMTPPDIGSQVLCTFVNGQPGRGYWFACINPGISQWMIPAIAAGNKIDFTSPSDDIKASILPSNHVPPQYLPVAEFNENVENYFDSVFYNNAKPIHEYQASILFQQGLDRDKVRGAISSSSQRETPSHVFGISTPGRALTKDPADDPEYASKVESGTIPPNQFAVPNRKGGHTFVMDDGDVTGADQLIRLRTAGGHQLLMNDDQSTVYLAHKDGTSWVEIDHTGVKIYTGGDMSVRAEGNFNLHADGDINMQALGALKIDAAKSATLTSAQISLGGVETTTIYGGKMNMGGGAILVSSDGQLTVSSAATMAITGSTIDINGGGGGSSIPNPTIPKNKLADTSYDAEKTKLWYSVDQAIDSVVSILPSHEPWVRKGDEIRLTKQVDSIICPPKVGKAPPASGVELPEPNSNNLDNGSPTPWTTDVAFINAVQLCASTLNLNYVDMLACMHLETGGKMDPSLQNSLGYTGLIQFGKAAATSIGTTTDALKAMDRATQCQYVTKYFQFNNLNGKASAPRLVDIYLTILWPAAVGKPENFVIWASGTPQYNANPSFDKSLPNPTGSVTVQSVENIILQHQATVKQALANAGLIGSATNNVVRSSNGTAVTDGSGNPVTTSNTSNGVVSTDGISEAAGNTITLPTCPAEYLSKSSTYNPSGGIGDSSPKLSQAQVKAMMAELGYFESRFDYALVSDNGRIGKYQVDAQYLADAGYIKSDAIAQYSASNALSQDESWSGEDNIQSQDDFLGSPNTQDTIQFNEFSTNYDSLISNGGIQSTDDICTVAGMLFVAHQFRSTDQALQWRQQGGLTDSLGRNGSVYFNQGRYAIDILASGGAAGVPSTPSTSGADGGANTTGIDPDSVFTFQSSGSGTRSNFDQLNGAFKNAILQMAQDFKTQTGAKIAINSAYRSPADQEAIYQKWLAAGGGPNKPTAGGITTPAKPVSAGGAGSPHNNGVAIDSSQCPLIARTVTLAQYGLRWGGTFSTPDTVHIQLDTAV